MAVREWELVSVLIYLLSQLDGHLVVDVQVSGNGGRLQCVLAPIANADHHMLLGIQRHHWLSAWGTGWAVLLAVLSDVRRRRRRGGSGGNCSSGRSGKLRESI